MFHIFELLRWIPQIIEGIFYVGFMYHLTKYSCVKYVIALCGGIFIASIIGDPILYYFGFIWTAHNLSLSVFINAFPFVGGLIGVGISAKKN